jgi:hypothetical protein
MSDLATPLPTIDFDLPAEAPPAFEWPQPPFARHQPMQAMATGAQPCRIETRNGVTVEGTLETFEPAAAQLRFRSGPASALTLPFERFRRLVVAAPWALASGRLHPAAHERDFRIALDDGAVLAGRTFGHVQTPAGVFLFVPVDCADAVQRQFVPQAVIADLTWGKTAEETAAARFVATPDALLAALEAQRHSRIQSIGDTLIELGLVTRATVDLMLAQQGPGRDRPLGEMLVAAGHLERADLQTALARKMGYPMVDLTRFAVEPDAAARMTRRSIAEYRALPLMRRGQRLIVVVDDLARIAPLKALGGGLAGLEIVPVLAPRSRLSALLATLPQALGSDMWASNEPL